MLPINLYLVNGCLNGYNILNYLLAGVNCLEMPQLGVHCLPLVTSQWFLSDRLYWKVDHKM